MALLCRTLPQTLTVIPKSVIILQQPVRFKKFGRAVIPHGKPRWIPMARSKMFKDPPQCTIEPEEVDHKKELEDEYTRRVRALVQYLDEDHLKNSDVGEAAVIEAQREEEEHQQLLKLNEEENARVAALRDERLARAREERRAAITRDLEEHQRAEVARLASADRLVANVSAQMEKQILPEKLEEAINAALDAVVDPEFAIDTQGHIYRGRTTKSLLMPEDQRVKMEPAPKIDRPIELDKSSFIQSSN